MEVLFLGVGDAFDESVPNTSIWIEGDGMAGHSNILLDCGATVPPSYWSRIGDAEKVDGIWISHFHADHFFGLPLLLYSFHRDRRRKPLVILGPSGIRTALRQVLDLAFPGLRQALTFSLVLERAEPARPRALLGLLWSFTELPHNQRNLAVRIDSRRGSLYYSGDGQPTSRAIALARGCDLVIHEAFRLDAALPAYGHGTVAEAIDFTRRAGVAKLALVHLEWTLRRKLRENPEHWLQNCEDLQVFPPDPGQVLIL